MYPETILSNTYHTRAKVIKDPRFAGLRKPKQATARVMKEQQRSWDPVPTKTDKNIADLGGRNTSP